MTYSSDPRIAKNVGELASVSSLPPPDIAAVSTDAAELSLEVPTPSALPTQPLSSRPHRRKDISVSKAHCETLTPVVRNASSRANVEEKRAKPHEALMPTSALVPVRKQRRKKIQLTKADGRLRSPARRVPKAHKARAIKLRASISTNSAMVAVLAACCDHWEKNIQAAVAGHVDALHQARVGIRRFRTALTLFRDYMPTEDREVFRAEVSMLNAALGPARDLDVFIRDLSEFAASNSAKDADVKSVSVAAKHARSRAGLAVAAAVTSRRYRRFMGRLDNWLTDQRWQSGKRKAKDGDNAASDFARNLLNRRLEKIRKQAKNIKKAHVEELHKLRIDIKKARYALEFFESLLPLGRFRQVKRQLEKLQDSLGRLNDVEVLKRTMKTLKASVRRDQEKDAIRRGGRIIAAHFCALGRSNRSKAMRAGVRLRLQKSF